MYIVINVHCRHCLWSLRPLLTLLAPPPHSMMPTTVKMGRMRWQCHTRGWVRWWGRTTWIAGVWGGRRLAAQWDKAAGIWGGQRVEMERMSKAAGVAWARHNNAESRLGENCIVEQSHDHVCLFFHNCRSSALSAHSSTTPTMTRPCDDDCGPLLLHGCNALDHPPTVSAHCVPHPSYRCDALDHHAHHDPHLIKRAQCTTSDHGPLLLHRCNVLDHPPTLSPTHPIGVMSQTIMPTPSHQMGATLPPCPLSHQMDTMPNPNVALIQWAPHCDPIKQAQWTVKLNHNYPSRNDVLIFSQSHHPSESCTPSFMCWDSGKKAKSHHHHIQVLPDSSQWAPQVQMRWKACWWTPRARACAHWLPALAFHVLAHPPLCYIAPLQPHVSMRPSSPSCGAPPLRDFSFK